jgi:methylthioribulose-1-phosphate dehydratase
MHPHLLSTAHRAQQQELVRAVHYLHSQGWAPATSSNYSFRAAPGWVCISRSGVDKGQLTYRDLMYVDPAGTPLWPRNARPSAETGLHCAIYTAFPGAGCVLHTHSVANTTLSHRHLALGEMVFHNLEIQKGIAGQTSHHDELRLPIFPNTQHIPTLVGQLYEHWELKAHVPGFLIAGHGLYAWGATIAEAKRHIETWEFLMQCSYY